MADIAKVKAFAYKSVFKKEETTYRNTGYKTWTAPWYSYLFQDDAGNGWYLTQWDLERYTGQGYIRVTETAK